MSSDAADRHPSGLYPWQERQWAQLNARVHAGTLPHALLLTGARGMGKQHFTRLLTRKLLCDSTGEQGALACEHCRSCTLFEAGTHPDITYVMPEQEGKAIKIDQIRALMDFVGLTSHCAGYKIVVVTPAEQMNAHAAGSLLKTLEEPASDSVLLLVTEHPAALPPTIRSRCQEVAFPAPAPAAAAAWLRPLLPPGQDPGLLLALSGGAPLQALMLAATAHLEQRRVVLTDLDALAGGRADPISTAQTWLKWGLAPALLWLHGYVVDMIRLRSVPGHPGLAHRDAVSDLQRLVERLDLNTLFQILDRVTEASRLAKTQVNQQMLLEDLLISWASYREHQPGETP